MSKKTSFFALLFCVALFVSGCASQRNVATPAQKNPIEVANQMDRMALELAGISNARVESFTDTNNLKALKIRFDADVLFVSNGSTLSESARNSLADLARILNENHATKIAVFGHTDNVGTLDANQRLSRNRAGAVSAFLRSNRIANNRIIETAGRGFSEPIANNATAEGRAQNRRIEIFVYAR